MELIEYIRIFSKHRRLFVNVVIGCVVVALLVFFVQPMRYRTEITMNVARSGEKVTTEYTYDDFYRLQADERFADTVVRWLQSPRIVVDIAKKANLPKMISFQADRLSSQVIRIRYLTRDEASARRTAPAIFEVLNAETSSLNTKADETAGWFALVGDTPSIADGRIGWRTLLSGAVLLGVFLGFFSVFLKEYFEQARGRR